MMNILENQFRNMDRSERLKFLQILNLIFQYL